MNCRKLQTWVQVRKGEIVEVGTFARPSHFTGSLLKRGIPLNGSKITTLVNFLKTK